MQFSPGRPSPLIRCLHQQNIHIFKNDNLFSITLAHFSKAQACWKLVGVERPHQRKIIEIRRESFIFMKFSIHLFWNNLFDDDRFRSSYGVMSYDGESPHGYIYLLTF